MDEYRQRESLSFDKVSRQKRRSRYLKWSFDNPLLVGGFVIVVFLCLVMVMGTSMGPRSGIIQRSDIGSIALYDFKAPRDFVYERVDRDATERVRAQRMADVLPIFRWESAYRDSVIAGVTRGFESMRERLMRHREAEMFKRIPKILGQVKLSPEEARRYALLDAMFGKFDQDPAFEPFLTTRPLRDEEIKDSVAQWSSLNHPELEAVMGHFVDPEVFAWFVANNFSKSLQDSLIQVLDTVLSRKIVTSRLDLDIAPRINVQWQEGGERRTQRFDESDKAIISTVETSLSLMRSLLEERITDAPEEVRAFFLRYVRANLEYDEAATQRERQSVSDRTAELRIIEEFKRGQTIVSSGDPIKLEHFELFEKMLQAQDEIDNRAGHWFGVSAIMALLMFLIWYPLVTANPGGRNRNRDIVFLATSVLAFAVCLRLAALLFSALDSVYHFSYSLFLLFPFAAGGMLVRLVVNRLYSYIFAIIAVILTTLLPEDQTMLLPYAFMCAMSGSLQMERPKRTNAIFRRGIVLGLMAAIMGVAIYCFRGIDISLRDGIGVAILGLGSGLFSAGVVMIGLPLTETIFGYATSNKLLELSNLEHPALQALFKEAPGTYQHAMMVGSLNEAAADAIGANAILARVGGYYHDIGKVKNAQYFAENQRGDNPHNRLKPNMSALILKAHVRDGQEIAKKYHLPKDVADFIATHHGTSRIEYFYQRAKDQQERVREEDYRYPGPRPQTRETGICMVSDMVEAAVRSLPEKTPDRILALVHKLINHKFADGQFDECDLTLRDLDAIAKALVGVLNAFYHHRPQYPDQKRERDKAEAEKRDKSEETADVRVSQENPRVLREAAEGAGKAVSKASDESRNASHMLSSKENMRVARETVDAQTTQVNLRVAREAAEGTEKAENKLSGERKSAPMQTTESSHDADTSPILTDTGLSADRKDKDEVDALLKDEISAEDAVQDVRDSIRDAYDLTFSSQVDVFKKK